MIILFIPLIPILAIGLIASSIAVLVWYSNLNSKEKENADKAAFRFFGKSFNNLTQSQKENIRKKLTK